MYADNIFFFFYLHFLIVLFHLLYFVISFLAIGNDLRQQIKFSEQTTKEEEEEQSGTKKISIYDKLAKNCIFPIFVWCPKKYFNSHLDFLNLTCRHFETVFSTNRNEIWFPGAPFS